jgi:Pretoxin HINT domain
MTGSGGSVLDGNYRTKWVSFRASSTELWRAEGSEEIITTDEHPFYVMGKGFTGAAKLVLGDVVKLAGERLSVVGDLKRNFNGQLAYNLSVANDPTYFVGQSRAWVHNCDVNYDDPANVALYEKYKASLLADEISGSARSGTALAKGDAYHRSASFVSTEQMAAGRAFTIKGGDGAQRNLLQTSGGMNGQKGVFEYIFDPGTKTVTHQVFYPGGTITGAPNFRGNP